MKIGFSFAAFGLFEEDIPVEQIVRNVEIDYFTKSIEKSLIPQGATTNLSF